MGHRADLGTSQVGEKAEESWGELGRFLSVLSIF